MRLTFGMLGSSAKAYCVWRAQPVSDGDRRDPHAINVLVHAQAENSACSYPFLADELDRAGIQPRNAACGGCGRPRQPRRHVPHPQSPRRAERHRPSRLPGCQDQLRHSA